MPGYSKLKLAFGDAAAIILNANQGLSAIVKTRFNIFCLRIDAVFDKLLEDACRPFDNFASGNLIAQFGR